MKSKFSLEKQASPPSATGRTPGYSGHVPNVHQSFGKPWGEVTRSSTSPQPKTPKSEEFESTTSSTFRVTAGDNTSPSKASHIPGYTGYIPQSQRSPGKSNYRIEQGTKSPSSEPAWIVSDPADMSAEYGLNTSNSKWQIPGYTGHVPQAKQGTFGISYQKATQRSLS